MDPSVVLIAVLAVLAPLCARLLSRWVHIPIIVFEMVLGIVAGPAVLGWVHPSDFLHTLSQFGLAMLFFVAGTEIEVGALRGRTGAQAGIGWLVSVAAGIGVGLIVAPGDGALIIGIALCSTALGTLLPILRDAGEVTTPFGHSIGALGAVGEFGPLVAIAVLLGGKAPGVAAVTLIVFAAVAALVLWYAIAVPQGLLHRAINATLHTSAQYGVRLVLLIVAALVTLTVALGIDMLMGAFTAGLVWRLLIRDADAADQHAVESKIEAVAFGFLVPVFFIYTGVTFDLSSLEAQPLLLLAVPVAALTLLVVRGIPAMFAAPAGAGLRERIAVGVMAATALPIIVVVTGIGVDLHLLSRSWAAVLLGGGMLSVLVFPLVSMALHRARAPQPAAVPAEA